MSRILPLAISAVILFIVAALVWPALGLLGYMGIYLVKAPLRVYFPWLVGFWGYLLDMGFVCIAILGIWRANLKERKPGEIFIPRVVWICLIVLALWIWLRLPASRDQNIGTIKALILSIFDTATIILGFLFGRTQAGLRRMVRALILIGIIAVVGVLIFGTPEQEGGARITLGYANPLAPADMAAYMVIALTGLWLAKRTVMPAVFTLVAAIFVTGTILSTGTRGPFLMLAVALLMMAYLHRRQVNLRTIVTVVLFIGIVIFAFRFYLAVSGGGITERFSMVGIQRGIMARIEMSKVSLRGWARSPILGTGPGDFSVQMEGVDITRYPHNLILEVLNELGLIGLIPYLVLFYYGFRSIKLLSSEELDGSVFKMYAVIVFGVFIYHFVGTFKGGGYAGSNIFYLSWGAVIGAASQGSYEYMQLSEYYNVGDSEVSDSMIMEWHQEQDEIIL